MIDWKMAAAGDSARDVFWQIERGGRIAQRCGEIVAAAMGKKRPGLEIALGMLELDREFPRAGFALEAHALAEHFGMSLTKKKGC